MSARGQKWFIAQRLFNDGGWPAVVRGAARYIGRRIGHCRQYYILEHTVAEWPEEKFRPPIENLTLRVIHSNEEADTLAPAEDFRKYLLGARRALDHKATAFCLFVGTEFANVGWVIFSAETKRFFDVIPYHVDFAHGEVCTGGSWTRPKFRGRGLATYNFCLRNRYLHHLGYVRMRCAIATTNKASLSVHAPFDPIIRARGWFVRLGKWRYWKESTLPPR